MVLQEPVKLAQFVSLYINVFKKNKKFWLVQDQTWLLITWLKDYINKLKYVE